MKYNSELFLKYLPSKHVAPSFITIYPSRNASFYLINLSICGTNEHLSSGRFLTVILVQVMARPWSLLFKKYLTTSWSSTISFIATSNIMSKSTWRAQRLLFNFNTCPSLRCRRMYGILPHQSCAPQLLVAACFFRLFASRFVGLNML